MTMKMTLSKHLGFGVSAVLLVVLLSFCPSTLAHTKNRKDIPPPVEVDDFQDCFDKVYAFGDSSTDTGNGFILGTVKAYVKQFLTKYAASYAGGDGALQGHRLSNGRLVVDYLCEALGRPSLPPYKSVSANFSHGVNFAVAGSTVLGSELFKSGQADGSEKLNVTGKFNMSSSLMWSSIPQSYWTQIDWFTKYVHEKECPGKGPQACKESLANDLFWIGGLGLSDYARVFKPTPAVSKTLTGLCVDHVQKFITTLLEMGAKFVVVESLPPMGCQSMELSLCNPSDAHDEMGCVTSSNEMVMAHNDLLKKAIEALKLRFRDATIVYADVYAAYKKILANHKLYQIVEPFKACCGAGTGELKFELDTLCGLPDTVTCKDPSKYMNWDGIHLTDAMNRNIADLLFNRGQCKPEFQELIAKRKSAVAAHDASQ